MPRFFSWLVNRLRFKRFTLSGRVKKLEQYAIYSSTYSNWKHDPQPLIFVMYSGDKYTHGINIHYMSVSDKQWFAKTLFLLKKGGQVLTGENMYRLLKLRRMSIVKTCYRVYFTSLLNAKMVSAGLTPLDSLVYSITKDPWILALNEMLEPNEIGSAPEQIAYSPTELQDRIMQVMNSTPLQQKTVGTQGPAPYTRPAPYATPAPWVRGSS